MTSNTQVRSSSGSLEAHPLPHVLELRHAYGAYGRESGALSGSAVRCGPVRRLESSYVPRATTPPPTTSGQSFIDFFTARGHTYVPSASLIPHDPTLLFNVAGMVPFKPYFLGDEKPPYKRAVSSQKCVRAGGKHNDLDDVGRTKRHLVFFEMLGNFSFGDYFKEFIIPASWELVTEVWGIDGDRLWITVHESDDEAEAIWHEQVGVADGRGSSASATTRTSGRPARPARAARAARSTSTAAPSSVPTAGRSHDKQGDRFMEFWNLVFMQYDRDEAGVLTPLPEQRRSTPVPASSGSPCCSRASTRCGRPT